MKKTFKVLIIFFLFIVTANASQYNIINPKTVVDKLNQFRKSPVLFIKSENIENININNVFSTWSNKEVQWLTGKLPMLQNDSYLENLAMNHLESIISTFDISHLTDADILNGCDYIFSGETLIGVAFQNYVTLNDFENILVKYFVKNAVLLKDAESSPILFPYDKVGAAILTTNLNIEGTDYNIYLVDIIYAVSKYTYNNEVYGRIIGDDLKGAYLKIFNDKGMLIDYFTVNPDGSFNILLPKEGMYKFVIILQDGTKIERIINYYYKSNIILILEHNVK